MNKLPKDKASGSDNIINKVLCIVTLIILKDLVQAVIDYLNTGLPNGLKESFTFVLQKEGKKDYLLPGTYKPIALKNILAKLAEKVIIILIIKKVKAELLLI